MRELYVYYTVRAGEGTGFAAEIAAVQRAVADAVPGLRARALCRDHEAGLPDATAANRGRTWMEIYATDPERLPAGVDAGMQALIEATASGLAPFIDGDRHIEAFVTAPVLTSRR